MTDAEKAVIKAALEWKHAPPGRAVAHAIFALGDAVVALEQEREAAQWRVNPEPGRTKLTIAQRDFMVALTVWHRPVTTEYEDTDAGKLCYRNTTQLRRLLPFVRANSHLIEELPRTPRGGWGYKLKDGVDPNKVVIP